MQVIKWTKRKMEATKNINLSVPALILSMDDKFLFALLPFAKIFISLPSRIKRISLYIFAKAETLVN